MGNRFTVAKKIEKTKALSSHAAHFVVSSNLKYYSPNVNSRFCFSKITLVVLLPYLEETTIELYQESDLDEERGTTQGGLYLENPRNNNSKLELHPN